MLTKQRQEIIVRLVEERGSIQVTEVRDLLGASESTIRRDITALDKEGKLVKVFGGAVAETRCAGMRVSGGSLGLGRCAPKPRCRRRPARAWGR